MPAYPDHCVKRDMFALLQCNEISTTLTDSPAMHHTASFSDFYLTHPQAQYFNVGRDGGKPAALACTEFVR